MSVHPLLFWLWAYSTIGLVMYIAVNAWKSEETKPEDLSIGFVTVVVAFWPLIVVLLFINMLDWLKEKHNARKATVSLTDYERLKEENEALKDKLYELEP